MPRSSQERYTLGLWMVVPLLFLFLELVFSSSIV